jgi:hypothetical protein
MNYERLIIELLVGDTPKAKYDHLVAILKVSEQVCYPRRGTEDDRLDVFDVAELLTPHIKNPNA